MFSSGVSFKSKKVPSSLETHAPSCTVCSASASLLSTPSVHWVPRALPPSLSSGCSLHLLVIDAVALVHQ